MRLVDSRRCGASSYEAGHLKFSISHDLHDESAGCGLSNGATCDSSICGFHSSYRRTDSMIGLAGSRPI